MNSPSMKWGTGVMAGALSCLLALAGCSGGGEGSSVAGGGGPIVGPPVPGLPGQLKVSWTPPRFLNNGTPAVITSYNVYYEKDAADGAVNGTALTIFTNNAAPVGPAGACGQSPCPTNSGAVNTFTVTGLASTTAYCFVVTACTAVGLCLHQGAYVLDPLESQFSNEVCATTP